MNHNTLKVANSDFSFLDQASFRELYSVGDINRKIRFYVEGIRCAKCLRKIEGLAGKIRGLSEVRVELGKNLVHVNFDSSCVSPSVIASELSGLGFKVKALPPQAKADVQIKDEDRKALIRVAVAGACAGNIMAFSTAIYLGSERPWLTLFSWLSLILYLPVVSYVAWPFYQGAWNSIRRRHISIDLPMAIASIAGFVFSAIELIRGRSDFYFDSMSSFLFLILLARLIQARIQRRFLSHASQDDLYRVRLLTKEKWKWIPTDQLTLRDEFLVESDETLPVEAQLLSDSAHISLAWLTGESRPRQFLAGAIVPAGSRLISGKTRFGFLKPLSQTPFGQTLDEVHRFAATKNRAISLSDRLAQRLLITVFILAALFVAFYWHVSPEEALRRALALIVLACPCAMAFGTPLAIYSSLRRAKVAGLLISDANAIESIDLVRNIFLDKTGTLTDLDISLKEGTKEIPAVYKKIILALENDSFHPIAFAFRKQFGDQGNLPAVDNRMEVPGLGVSGYIFGKAYCLRAKPETTSESPSCALFEDDKLLFEFTFEANLKPGTKDTLDALRRRGYHIQLLSGDQSQPTHQLANLLGFKSTEVHANLSPNDKAAIVGATLSSMMIGDGVNDAQALMRADVGVAVAGAVGAALNSSKVYLTSEKLSSVIDLFDIAKRGRLLDRQNLTISLIYNSVGATLALSGFIDPLVAAVLMPLSSGLILLNTLRQDRR